MKFKSRKLISLLGALLFAGTAFAASEEKLDHDYSILSVFVQPSISFLSFEERKYFQEAIDTIYYGFKSTAVNSAESLNVAKQDFQKVNFCFPITAGIQWQFAEDQFLSAGIGFIYDHESVVLTDAKSSTHSYEYTLQGVPFFLEYRLALPKNVITLNTGGLFSVAVRWYWVLPGTEIYTTWGYLGAKTPLWGAGFGVSVGYLFASWNNFKLYGDIGFNSISVKSEKMFSHIVPNGPDENAKWNLGGLQMQIRGSFGFWNKPKPKDDDDDDDDDGEGMKSKLSKLGKKPNVKIIDDTKKDSVKADSVNVTDSTNAVADSAKVADSLKTTADSTKSIADSAKVADTLKTVADSLKTADSLGTAANTKAIADTSKTAVQDSAKVVPTPAKEPTAPAKAPAEKSTPATPAKEVKTKGD